MWLACWARIHSVVHNAGSNPPLTIWNFIVIADWSNTREAGEGKLRMSSGKGEEAE